MKFFRWLKFPLFIFLFYCLSLLLVNSSVADDKSVDNQNQSSGLDILAGELVEKLNDIISLDGEIIQISENNFWELETNNNLPFSFHLKEELAGALAQYGVKQSLQEVGGEPLQLLGTYAIEKEEVNITIRIRKNCLSSAQDIVVTKKIPRKFLENEWLLPSFHRVGNTLIRILANNCVDQGLTYNVSVKPLRPGIRGGRSLILAQTFKKDLQAAVALSPMFTESAYCDVAASLYGTYEEIGKHIRFHLILKDNKDDRIISNAIYAIPKNSIPDNLLGEVYSISSIPRIVVIPPHVSASDFEEPFVDETSKLINGFLTSNGFKSVLDKKNADLHLYYSLNIQNRESKKSKFTGASLIKLNMRVSTADSGNIVSEKTGSVSLKYSKRMSQFDINKKYFEALGKTTEGVCKVLSREITSYYLSQR